MVDEPKDRLTPSKEGQLPYELMAPVSGAGARDPRSALLLWGAGSVLVGGFVTFLLIRGELRMLTLVLLAFLGLASLAPTRGVYLMTAFLPFMFFLRRFILNYQDFAAQDPILMFPVVTTMAMFLGVVVFNSQKVFHYVQQSSLIKACSLLGIVFLLQVINPLQGNILVGMAGATYFIYPLMWVFIGLVIDKKDLPRVLALVLGIGAVTAAYGIYQHFFGLSEAEIYELKSKNFFKAMGGLEENIRVMSTFSGLVDFSRYMTISGFLAFAFFWRRKRPFSLLFILGLSLWALLYTASRTSFIVLAFTIVMLLIVTGKNVKRIGIRASAALMSVIILYAFVYQYDPTQIYDQRFSSNPFVVHTVSGITHPTHEGSFQTRIRVWTNIVSSTILAPWGNGLGSTTTASAKFGGERGTEADSYFFELIYGSGIAACILFIAICFMLMRSLLVMCVRWPEEYHYKICFGLMCGVILSSVFGVSARDRVSGPLAWLVVGWIAREYVDRKTQEVTIERAPEVEPLPQPVLALRKGTPLGS